ncbi:MULTISPECIES: hypothetical protein [unclassified Bradyrhizobium]|uniref:hypothetical protein n=1 Tax=unclassified Bradyrhizobium TaxID=2631580 RepID=UPI002FEF42DB
MTGWNAILSTEQLAQHWANVAKLDAGFAARAQAWWHNQDCNTLRSEMAGAWLANLPEAYCIARSYLAMRAPWIE